MHLREYFLDGEPHPRLLFPSLFHVARPPSAGPRLVRCGDQLPLRVFANDVGVPAAPTHGLPEVKLVEQVPPPRRRIRIAPVRRETPPLPPRGGGASSSNRES